MAAQSANLLPILQLERLELDLFRGASPEPERARVFGGQVVAQALTAAISTVSERAVHSLHAYFLLAGDAAVPIIYDVARLRDGGSFSTRRVRALQHGQTIFEMSASFHAAETGLTHQFAMPETVDPESLPDAGSIRDMPDVPSPVRAYFDAARPIEMRPVDMTRYRKRGEAREPRQAVWFRTSEPLPDDDGLHQAALAYASDKTLLDTALVTHGKTVFSMEIMAASLDHAVWFHRPFRADDWLLYVQDSPSSGHGLGLARGLIFSRDGRLVASTAQEGLIRVRKPKPSTLF
jgi:acyl-CoA thioesterase-2